MKAVSKKLIFFLALAALCVAAGFLYASFTAEQDLPEGTVRLYTAQLTHDGSSQTIVLDTSRAETEQAYYLSVLDKSGRVLWQGSAALPHAGWNALFLARVGGEDYLLQYNPVMYQGSCTYVFRVFSLNTDGEEILLDSDRLEFGINPPGGMGAFRMSDVDSIKSFYSHVNEYLPQSGLLLCTDDYFAKLLPEGTHYGTQQSPIVMPRDYFYGGSDLTIDEQLDSFILDYLNDFGEIEQ